ncbi:MAG: translation initiation factor IF-2 [Parcubacteria group bacterium]
MKEKVEETSIEIRPPVVGVFGHIDHGKSTLIDYIRKTNTTDREAGGITQHVSAYEIVHNMKDGRNIPLTFIDTPGHEAFSGIRTRGASIADIAVLVVSAEDGVKPQTLEVMKYIKASNLPFLVAITKIDKPSANVAQTKQSLAENGVYVEGYGGDTSVVEVSAISGEGVDDFLDMIVLMSEIDSKSGDRDTLGEGIIVEGRLDPKRGITGVGIIKNGTVRSGLFAGTSGAVTPIRFLLDASGNQVEELSFSSPIQIVGWDNMPKVGEVFKTFLKKDEALAYRDSQKIETVEKKVVAEENTDIITLPLIIKADAVGSLEALTQEISKTDRERIKSKVILSGVGSVNENDVKTALSTSGATIISFNTKIDSSASALAERSGISVISGNIIYEITDKIKEILLEREPKIEVEEVSGSAKILKIFSSSKGKQVLGGKVLTGILENNAMIKITRREVEIGYGRIKEMQSAKIKVNSVLEGNEFGALIESKVEISGGDVIEAFKKVTK